MLARMLAPLFAVLVLVLPARALAYTVYVCIDWHPGYDDANSSVGDDWLVSNPTTIDAYGAKVVVKNLFGSTIFSGYVSDTTGCSTSFSASGSGYDVTVYSEASIDGNTFYYRPEGAPTSLYTTAWSSVSFSDHGYYTLDSGDTHMSRVMGILSYALKNENLGLSGKTINVWRKPDTSSQICSQSSCTSGGEIYYLVDTGSGGTDHSRVKNVLAHELGHKMMLLYAGVSTIPHDYDASATGSCDGGAGHQRDSVEWHSAAVVEGYAHYYASVVFNTIGGAGCGAYSHYAVNWDHVGGTNGNKYECDAAPVSGLGLSTGDYMGDECGPSFTAGTANEYDYQRFFWDLGDKTPPYGSDPLYAADIAEVIDLAATDPQWNATYSSSYPGNLNNPKDRLYNAAATFGTTWDNQDDFNGVTR